MPETDFLNAACLHRALLAASQHRSETADQQTEAPSLATGPRRRGVVIAAPRSSWPAHQLLQIFLVRIQGQEMAAEALPSINFADCTCLNSLGPLEPSQTALYCGLPARHDVQNATKGSPRAVWIQWVHRGSDKKQNPFMQVWSSACSSHQLMSAPVRQHPSPVCMVERLTTDSTWHQLRKGHRARRRRAQADGHTPPVATLPASITWDWLSR